MNLRGRILVVDDNPDNREMLARRLIRDGYDVVTAENGLNALARIGEEPFDAMLLAIMMPQMDGYQVLAELQCDAELRHIPVIVTSAIYAIDSVVRCIELGAEDYLFKPVNAVLLKDADLLVGIEASQRTEPVGRASAASPHSIPPSTAL